MVKSLNQYADGADSLADGVTEYIGKVGEAASGAASVAEGAKSLTDGTAALVSGATQVKDGIGKLKEGTSYSISQIGDSASKTMNDSAASIVRQLPRLRLRLLHSPQGYLQMLQLVQSVQPRAL